MSDLLIYQDFLFRYVEGNCKLSSTLKLYNKEIPEFLHDRPNFMVTHCQEKIIAAENFNITDVSVMENDDMPSFKVKSHSTYEVKLGNKKCLPSCQCLDWETTRLPCKHFFAVFKCCPKWSFHDLPEHYRECPFLTLDESVMFGPTNLVHPKTEESSQNCSELAPSTNHQ